MINVTIASNLNELRSERRFAGGTTIGELKVTYRKIGGHSFL